MAAGKSVSDILAGAKSELSRADALDKSVKSALPAVEAKHEYSNAPYSLAQSKPASGLGEELKAKGVMVAKARKALEQ